MPRPVNLEAAARPGPARGRLYSARPGPARGPRGPARGPRGSLPAGRLHLRVCALLASCLTLYVPKYLYMAKYRTYNAILLGDG